MTTQKSVVTADPTASQPGISMNLDPSQSGLFSKSLNANSAATPPGDVTEAWSGNKVMTAGAATIDLTSLTQVGLSSAVSLSGLKIRAIQILAPAANAAAITVAPGASNGYTQIGTVGPIKPGGSALLILPGTSAVDGTHKNLDISGTGTDSVSIQVVAGPT